MELMKRRKLMQWKIRGIFYNGHGKRGGQNECAAKYAAGFRYVRIQNLGWNPLPRALSILRPGAVM